MSMFIAIGGREKQILRFTKDDKGWGKDDKVGGRVARVRKEDEGWREGGKGEEGRQGLEFEGAKRTSAAKAAMELSLMARLKPCP